MAGYRHIVFATDLTDAADRAAGRAAEQAHCSGGRLTLLHVVEHYPEELAGIKAEEADPETYLREQADKRLGDFADRLGLSTAQRQVLLGRYSARQAILDYLREQQADLVVLGTIGNPGKLGTTVDHVAANAPCDVLVVQGRGWTPG